MTLWYTWAAIDRCHGALSRAGGTSDRHANPCRRGRMAPLCYACASTIQVSRSRDQ
jgi:hypothetical protein